VEVVRLFRPEADQRLVTLGGDAQHFHDLSHDWNVGTVAEAMPLRAVPVRAAGDERLGTEETCQGGLGTKTQVDRVADAVDAKHVILLVDLENVHVRWVSSAVRQADAVVAAGPRERVLEAAPVKTVQTQVWFGDSRRECSEDGARHGRRWRTPFKKTF